MTERDLLKAIGGVSDELVLKARENRSHCKHSILIAAAAAALLLVGCTAVYLLHIWDMHLGQNAVVVTGVENTVIENTEDGENRKITIVTGDPQGDKTVIQETFSLGSWKGTPEYKAAQEWFRFEKTFDPDHSISEAYREKCLAELEKDPNFQGFFPKEYAYYNVYDQAMIDEVNRISEKYGLERITQWYGQYYDSQEAAEDRLSRFMGTGDFLRGGASVEQVISSEITKENRFSTVFFLKTPDLEQALLTSFDYIPRGVFDTRMFTLGEDEQWQECNYTTQSGDEVLILYSADGGFSWIFCQRSDAMLALRVESRLDTGYDDRIECTFLTMDQLKKVADAFNFTVQLNPDWDYVDQENTAYDEKIREMRGE